MKTILGVASCLALAVLPASAQVTINEFQANPTEKILKWDAAGVPSVGSGTVWQAPSFDASSWQSGNPPFGQGVAGLNTDLAAQMQGKAYSLYLRKTFSASQAQAESAALLKLAIDYDDGFVAYLNGVEIARKNLGPRGHFIYAIQRSYNPSVATQPSEVAIGPCHQFLVEGDNVLAIQVHNHDLNGDLKVDASLKTVGDSELLVGAAVDFGGSTGASRVFRIVDGAAPVTEGSGTPANWLTLVADPSASGAWDSLEILTTEAASGGIGDGGCLIYQINQLGASGTGASLFGPAADFSTAWLAGGVTAQMLEDTWVSFRYKTSPGALFGLDLWPAAGQGASALGGAPMIGATTAPAHPEFTFNGPGGSVVMSTDATGAGSTETAGAPWYGFMAWSSGNLANGQWSVSELASEPSPNGGASGVLRYAVIQVPAKIDPAGSEWFGMHLNGLRFGFWPRGQVTADDLARTRIRFRYRVTAGSAVDFRLEPDGGGYDQSLMLGELSSDGEWATYDGTLGSWGNAAAWLAHLNAGAADRASEDWGGYLGGRIVMSCPDIQGLDAGDGIDLDDFTIWYDTALPAEQVTRRDYSGSSNGQKTYTIDGSGVGSSAESGELAYDYSCFSSPDLRDGQMQITEDLQTASPGASGGMGVLKFCWTDSATVTSGGQTWWGWNTRGFASPGWPEQAVTSQVLERSRVKFYLKAPPGKSISLRLETDGLGYDERLDFGSFVGTGDWQAYDVSCGSAGNLEAFLAGINGDAERVNKLRFTFGGVGPISGYETGDTWWIDDLSIHYVNGEPVGTQVAKTFHGTPGAGITFTIDGSGAASRVGALNGITVAAYSSASLRNGVFHLVENISEPEGSGDGPGFLRLVTTTVPDTVVPGDHAWGFKTSPFSVPEWPQGQVTLYDLQRTRVKMRLRIPAGRQLGFRIEAEGTDQSCGMGTLSGDGTWQTYERTLSQGDNLAAFVQAVNANPLGNRLLLCFGDADAPSAYADGESYDFDNLELRYEGYGSGDADDLNFEDACGGMRHYRRVDATTEVFGYFGNFSAGSPVVSGVNSFDGIAVGMSPLAESIPAGATILAIDAGAGTLTLSANATATATQQEIVFGAFRHAGGVFADPMAAGFSTTVTEDDSPGAGYRGSDGHLRVDFHQTLAVGEHVGMGIDGVVFRNLRAGEVTADDLDATTLDFAVKIPGGVTWQFWLEPEEGGYEDRLDLGNVSGTGSWQEVSLTLVDRNSTRQGFISRLNLTGNVRCRLGFGTTPQIPPGVVLRLDDIRVGTWREYRVNLASLGDPSAFLEAVNGESLTSLLPVFTLESAAAFGGSTLSIDNFAIAYFGPPAASVATLLPQGSAGGAWQYFVGYHEPSGVVVDTKLVTDPFPVPAGKDEDYEDPHETRAWVELRNAGASPYDLSGHTLTDDPGKPALWSFPAGTLIPANGHLLVMCDNRIEANGASAEYLHASVELDRDGGYLALYQGSTQLDAVTYPAGQTPHQSYGRDATGGAWVFLDQATPLAANAGVELTAKCETPGVFAADGTTPLAGDFYDSAQTVTLSTPTAGATIRYTLDGSDPVAESSAYTVPLTIAAIDEKTGTVLRARAFKDGLVPSEIATRTFLIGQHEAIKTLPAFVMSGSNRRVWYDDMGILSIVGGTYDARGVWQPGGPETYNIPMLESDPAERPAQLEYMHADALTPGFNLRAGVRLSASTWSTPRNRFDNPYDSPWEPEIAVQKPSFNLFFRGAYGIGKLSYPLLPGYDVVRFDHLRLRAGKNDVANPHITDELCRRIFTAMGNEGITGTWCTLYVNGVFKGYYNLCERVREPFFQEHYASSSAWDVIYNGVAENGTREAFDTLVYTDLSRDLTVPANYDIVKAKLDIPNVCDYYLMKIYSAMWDWPGNNWAMARERSTGANSIFRFADWDSEGGFNAVGYTNKNVDYDTIGLDLKNNNTEVGRIFNRLQSSAEFRLILADRIQKHFFNGGVLDDRASLNANFWLKRTKDELKALVSPIMNYVIGQSFKEEWFNTWTDEVSGRRSHLFGNGPASFITHGYWPATPAAGLSLPSGIIDYGSTLTITAGEGTVYYTTDGSDPRLSGGAVNPNALVYTGPLTLTASGTIRVRVLHGGEWSPLNEASYVIDPDEPAHGNLVIAELMYHGAPPTAAELSLGYNADSFDYCRVMNIGSKPVSTAGLSFYGITCTLPLSGGNVPYVEPGECFLVVKSLDGFRYRYGTAYDSMIAAAYSANFSDSGEQVKLVYTPPGGGAAVDLVNFTYDDVTPWPMRADGLGASLLLVNPTENPDPSLVSNWVASCGVGGQPGGVPLDAAWGNWVNLSFPVADPPEVKGPDADPDGDGISNALEYALGTSPKLANCPTQLPQCGLVSEGELSYLGIAYRVSAGAVDAAITIETSGTLDGDSWAGGPGHTVLLGVSSEEADGSRIFGARDAVPLDPTEAPQRFIRIRVTVPSGE